MAKYTITMTDSEQVPAWAALCSSMRPGAQDSGRVVMHVETAQAEALEAALDDDDLVIEYEAR